MLGLKYVNVMKKVQLSYIIEIKGGFFLLRKSSFSSSFLTKKKTFNSCTQEIDQFNSFLFNLAWSKILKGTSQGNDHLTLNFHIKNTTSTNNLEL